MNCINTLNRSDGAGAELLYDGEGSNACEVITLSAPKRGSYKYYVSNYTGIRNGESISLAQAGAKVTLFHNGIPVRTFSAPEKEGKVWEVFELRDQGIVPIQEVYESTEGKGWWTEDKKLARLSERQTRADWIQSDGEWLYFVNPADDDKLYYCRKDGSDLTKFSDDRPADGRILLAEDNIYYLVYSEDYFEGYIMCEDIVRIKNDGTERTVIQKSIKLDGVWEYGACLTGYADGMLYYHNPYGGDSVISVLGNEVNTSVWTLSEENWDGDYPHYKYGQNSGKAVVVGGYIYYVDLIGESYSFCRKNLVSGEEECLRSQISWDPWLWGIYKGWLYYINGTRVVRTRFMDPGSFEEEQILANNGLFLHEAWWPGEKEKYSFAFYGNTCYYPGTGGQTYALVLDGSGEEAQPFEGSQLDGEFYIKSGIRESSIEACDKNGENRRLILDGSPFINQAAMAAYVQRLEGNNYLELEEYINYYGEEAATGYHTPYFACVDIDGDGVNELFVSMMTFWDFDMEYCRYNGWYIETMPNVLDNISGDELAFNRDAQEMVIAHYGRQMNFLSRYKYDGTQIDDMIFEREYNPESPQTLSADAEFESMKAIYFDPYPTLNFVENTRENRQKYLIDGTGTGWASN